MTLAVPLPSLVLFALAAFIAYYFLSGFIWGAGYYPTSKKEVDNTAELLELNKSSTLYDLGSGTGRMIITIAQRYGSRCVGVEVDPLKFLWSKAAIRRKKLDERVQVHRSNLLDVNLEQADRVFVFLSSDTKIMYKLRDKLFKEMKPGSLVVSYTHRFHNWIPDKVEDKLYLYSIPESKELWSHQDK